MAPNATARAAAAASTLSGVCGSKGVVGVVGAVGMVGVLGCGDVGEAGWVDDDASPMSAMGVLVYIMVAVPTSVAVYGVIQWCCMDAMLWVCMINMWRVVSAMWWWRYMWLMAWR